MKTLFIGLALFLFFSFLVLLPPKPALAAFSFNISSTSTTTISSGDQEVDISLSITDLPSESYFRAALQKSSGGSYFGSIKNNNGDWSNIQPLSGDCTGYFKVSDTSTSTLVLKFKVGDSQIDKTDYKLKAHRFTNACSYTEATNSYDFTLNFPTPTPSPSPSPTPAATPSPTPKPTPATSASPTIKPTVKPTAKPTISPTKISFKTASPKASVAGKFVVSTPKTSPSSSPSVLQSRSGSTDLIIKLSLVFGGIFLLISFLFFLPKILEHFFNKDKL